MSPRRVNFGPNPLDEPVTCTTCGTVRYYSPSERARFSLNRYVCARCQRKARAKRRPPKRAQVKNEERDQPVSKDTLS